MYTNSTFDSEIISVMRIDRCNLHALGNLHSPQSKNEDGWTFGLQYSKICVKRPLSKRPKIGLQDKLPHNAGQKYYRMLQGEHSAILLTFIKLPFVIKLFVMSFLSDRLRQVLLYILLYFKQVLIQQ